MKDYYAILEISRSASPEVIRAAYRTLAKRYHPDNADTGNPTMFRAVKEAHDILNDQAQRALYDAQSQNGFPGNGRAQQAPNRPQVWVNGIGWIDAADVQFPGGPGAAYPQNYPPQPYSGQGYEEMIRQAAGGVAHSLVDQLIEELMYKMGRRR